MKDERSIYRGMMWNRGVWVYMDGESSDGDGESLGIWGMRQVVLRAGG